MPQKFKQLDKLINQSKLITESYRKYNIDFNEMHIDLYKDKTNTLNAMRDEMLKLAKRKDLFTSLTSASKMIALQQDLFDKTKQVEVINRFAKTLPDFESIQKQISTHNFSEMNLNSNRKKRKFTKKDITEIFSTEERKMSFNELLQQLGKLEEIDLSGYETIKIILFKMLEKKKILQVFNENSQSIFLGETK